jgi:putative ABC transport system substrate-binding protein
MIGRRAFVASGLGLCAAPLAALAQQAGKVARIGMLLPNTAEIVARSPRIAAFLQGLRDLGWIEGQNLAIEWRFADGGGYPRGAIKPESRGSAKRWSLLRG